MNSVTVADWEVKILDAAERPRVIQILREEAEEFKEAFRSHNFHTAEGKTFDGAAFFDLVNSFEIQIPQISLNINLDFLPRYIRNIDRLITICPEYFELYYLKGKIYLLGLVTRENHLIENREQIDSDPALILIKKGIFEIYPIIEECLVKAYNLFEQSHSYHDYPPIIAYRSQIKTHLATYYRREAFSLAGLGKGSPEKHDDVNEIYSLIRHSCSIFEDNLRNEIFIDMRAVGITLANYANALKLLSDSHEKGLLYYKTAREICGDDPNIIAGINFYHEILKEKGDD